MLHRRCAYVTCNLCSPAAYEDASYFFFWTGRSRLKGSRCAGSRRRIGNSCVGSAPSVMLDVPVPDLHTCYPVSGVVSDFLPARYPCLAPFQLPAPLPCEIGPHSLLQKASPINLFTSRPLGCYALHAAGAHDISTPCSKSPYPLSSILSLFPIPL